ncbi:MAG: hypothetical protein CMO55_01695 [Verrucomicrobiales bacterium]|nr:hypothetical protein [Verrucomicrobiales bacterium]
MCDPLNNDLPTEDLMENLSKFAKRFREFLGDEQFRHFINKLNNPITPINGLYWWQEQAYERFSKEEQEFAGLSMEQIRENLLVCEEHLVPLSTGIVRVYCDNQGSFPPPKTPEAPNANLFEVRPAKSTNTTHTRVYFCQSCRDALDDQGITWGD